MAEQQPRKKRTRALPPIQRKSIVVKMQLKSSAVTQRVQGISDRLKTMTARIAGLYVLTTSNAEVRTRLETWFSAEIAEVDRRRQLLSTMHQMELKELGGQPAKFDIVTPDSYAIEIEVEHPIFWRVITAITEIDASAAELENMWLSGEIDDQTTFPCSKHRYQTLLRILLTVCVMWHPNPQIVKAVFSALRSTRKSWHL
ncbi:MAG: hypothetical protein LRY40_09470 [Shewanella fodinae]|nr:hypothetical protein [Shewanella fodinae]